MSTSAEEPSQINTLSEGQIFENRYQILSVLGRGGVGVVYKARHTHMDKMVAIKTLLRSVVSDDEESFQRFEREARTASSLDHVNIIKIFDFDKTASGLVFLVMEYLGGQTLEALLLETGHLDIDRFLAISVQICDGLHNAHKHKVIHRDIKPSNIMLVKTEGDGECVKIVDFGLAKLSAKEDAQSLTRTGAIIGTPLFMSPEQCRGLALDNRSDIYSLGCVFYLALTGRVPIQGASALDTLFQHTALKPASFAAIGAGVHLPPRLEQVIFKAMEKDPDLRHQSMLDFRTEIQNAILDPTFRPSAASPASSPQSAFAAHVVSADYASSARYADLVDSSPTVVSINKTPNSVRHSFKGESELKQAPGSEVAPPSQLNKPIVVVSVAAAVLVAVGAAAMINKPVISVVSSVPSIPSNSSAFSMPPAPSAKSSAEKPVAVVPEKSKIVVKEPKAKTEKTQKKAVVPVVAKAPAVSASSNTQTEMQQIESLHALARTNAAQKNWPATLKALDSCLRLQAKVFGARDYRLFPTLAGIIHCQMMLSNGAAPTHENLMLALDIFSSQRSVVLENVSKRPRAAHVWRNMASACLASGASTQDSALLNWSAVFYELTRKSWSDKTTPEYVELCNEYCQVLDLCGNRKKENAIRAEINLPPLAALNASAGAPTKGKPHESVKRKGRMVIRTYHF